MVSRSPNSLPRFPFVATQTRSPSRNCLRWIRPSRHPRERRRRVRLPPPQPTRGQAELVGGPEQRSLGHIQIQLRDKQLHPDPSRSWSSRSSSSRPHRRPAPVQLPHRQLGFALIPIRPHPRLPDPPASRSSGFIPTPASPSSGFVPAPASPSSGSSGIQAVRASSSN